MPDRATDDSLRLARGRIRLATSDSAAARLSASDRGLDSQRSTRSCVLTPRLLGHKIVDKRVMFASALPQSQRQIGDTGSAGEYAALSEESRGMSHAIRTSRLAAIAACLFLIAAVVSACGSSSSKSSSSSSSASSSTSATSTAAAATGTPKAGGSLTVLELGGYAGAWPTGLDPRDEHQRGRRPGSDELDLRAAVPARRRRKGDPRSGRVRHAVGRRQDVDDHAAAEPQVLRRHAAGRRRGRCQLEARPGQPVHLQADPSAGEVDHCAELDDRGIHPRRPRWRLPESAIGRQPELDRLAERTEDHGGAGVQDQAGGRGAVHRRQRHAQQHACAEEEPDLLADRASVPRQPHVQGDGRRRGRTRGAPVGRRSGLRRDGDPLRL